MTFTGNDLKQINTDDIIKRSREGRTKSEALVDNHTNQEINRQSKFLRPIRRSLRRVMLVAIDNGWFGLKPLQTHVVICGFSRSGSTLLLLMAETCVSNAKTFGRERRALGYHAQNELRNHPMMITKRPWDVLLTDEIREFYASRKAEVRFVLTKRDPRAILTSIYSRFSDDYFISPELWRMEYKYFEYARQFDDVIVVKFEDLVSRPYDVQQQLTQFIGWHIDTSFDQFHTRASPAFRGQALNTLRPLDKGTIDKWRQEKHRARIRSLLKEMPELPERLIEMRYESDTLWTRKYE